MARLLIPRQGKDYFERVRRIEHEFHEFGVLATVLPDHPHVILQRGERPARIVIEVYGFGKVRRLCEVTPAVRGNFDVRARAEFGWQQLGMLRRAFSHWGRDGPAAF